ncbi:hypothetical protein [Planktomarina temperata]|uniref:hypothetical protein n=1 Tax=Planktomarina temperata TaxID=1284658 RepID=UPI003C780995
MHGIVNRGLQLFLIEEYGEDFWRELAVRLDQESGFEALLLYDDEVTRGLMKPFTLTPISSHRRS